MIIKVSGLREAGQIRDVAAMGVGMMAFDFRKESERFVRMISSQAGIIPDYSEQRLAASRGYATQGGSKEREVGSTLVPQKVGVFADDMPQNIITRIYNYQLDAVQLDGCELPVMIDNLRRSVVPDICPNIIIIKTLHIHEAADVDAWKDYEHHADMLLLEIKNRKHVKDVVARYNGTLPFLLSYGIGPDDADFQKTISHPMLAGFDLDEGFETAPSVKDIARLQAFIQQFSL
jgi:phosphoribosylanthranilate isomerase